MLIFSHISCGVKQLCDLWKSPKDILLDNFGDVEVTIENLCMIIFSDRVRKTTRWGGSGLAKFIIKNRLGTVKSSPSKKNPNSNHEIQTWIWNVNQKNLSEWITTHAKTQQN